MSTADTADSPLSIVLLPLRIPSASDDVVQMLSSWLDSSAQSTAEFTAAECRADLQRLQDLRGRIAVPSNDAYADALQSLAEHQEYHCCLQECENRGIVTDAEGAPMLQLHWQAGGIASPNVELLDVSHSLAWERWNVMWNLAVLSTFQATQQPLKSKPGWSKAASHLQNAATLVRAMHTQQTQRSRPHHSQSDLQPPFLQLWQAMLVAMSQRCVYESLACARKPRHLLLAKIAAAAVPLFHECERLASADAANVRAMVTASPTIRNWTDHVRAWGMYMSSCAEHHQACIHHDRQQNGLEIARLDLSIRFGTLCMEFCETNVTSNLLTLQQTVETHTTDLQQRYDQAMKDYNDEKNAAAAEGKKKSKQQPIPDRSGLPEIRGEKLVNVDQPIDKVLGGGPKALAAKPMFANLLAPSVRRYVDIFQNDMDKYFFQMTTIAEERTENARKALASVHLPHSLTAYRQEQSGGGIPDELWDRVQTIQKTKKLQQLKSDLWGLRDVAEQARTTYKTIESQLDLDLECDQHFRQQKPHFEGHDAMEVQRTFRHSLGNYDRLLVTAQEGDQVLLRRLEILDTNPKYKLLQFQKAQLDRLLPGINGGGMDANAHPQQPTIDTSHLSRLLVELSTLFHERDVLLSSLKEEIAKADVHSQLVAVDAAAPSAEQDYHSALRAAQQTVQEGPVLYDLEQNMETQKDLLQKIFAENEHFQRARQHTMRQPYGGPANGTNPNSPASASDSCIAMIEDAMDEIEQLTKHLKEGKDFYDVVIPKLEKLKQQVGDVSARLTMERCEYDDTADRNRQELEDAAFAKRMSENNRGGQQQQPSSSQQLPPHSQQQQQQSYHQQPPPSQPPGPRVDDEKVATLVGMEFDPAKVVAALAKHDNNMDQALNELLSG